MSQRRYPVAEAYDERRGDFYRNNNRSERDFDDFRSEISRPRTADFRRPEPEFLREGYGRNPATGPLVLRERVTEDIERIPPRPKPREVEREEIVIRDREGPRPRPRDFERDDIVIRRGEGPRPREVERDQTDISIRRSEIEDRGPRGRDIERESINIRREEIETSRPRAREVDRDTIVIRPRERSLPPPRMPIAREREEVVIRRREEDIRPPPPPVREIEREEIVVRRREEELRSPPPPVKKYDEEEIVIRRRQERSPSPVRIPTPPPPPPPEPIIRPPIHQEIITHYKTIDHGVERARSPTPPPPPAPPSPPRDETLEIEIRRRGTSRKFYDEDIVYERETRERRERESELEVSRHRSLSSPRTRQAMWTEVTKDLVVKDAIEQFGYEYEETDTYYYVMDYLRYEDVLRLVELSEDIRRDRQERIREIQWEREELESRPHRRPEIDERIFEREVVYDRRGSRYR